MTDNAAVYGNILDSSVRAENINEMYLFLEQESLSLTFEQMIKKLHSVGLKNWDLTKLRRYSKTGEIGRQRMEQALVGEYRDDSSFGYTSMETSGYFYVAPSSRDIPELMDALSKKYEELIVSSKASVNPHLLAIWAMVYVAILHPFYEGNGRVSRAMLPYTQRRLGLRPQFIENLSKRPLYEMDEVTTTEIGKIYELGGIYPEQMESGGISAALRFAQTVSPTYEAITTYQARLKAGILRSIEETDWNLLQESRTFQKAVPLLQSMPENLIE